MTQNEREERLARVVSLLQMIANKLWNDVFKTWGKVPLTDEANEILTNVGTEMFLIETDLAAEKCSHGLVEFKGSQRFLSDYVHSGICKKCGASVYRIRGRRWVSTLTEFMEES